MHCRGLCPSDILKEVSSYDTVGWVTTYRYTGSAEICGNERSPYQQQV